MADLITTTLAWQRIDPADPSTLPDSDITVLMWVEDEDGEGDWYAGWYDQAEGCWMDSTAMPVLDTVTHWAHPCAPVQAEPATAALEG